MYVQKYVVFVVILYLRFWKHWLVVGIFCQYLENKFVKFHYIIILSKNGILKPNQNVKRKHAHKITRALFGSAICLHEFARLDVVVLNISSTMRTVY